MAAQNDMREHWEKVYTDKQPHEMSWTQPNPGPSLRLLSHLQLPKDAHIIDIGGGDSHLVNCLLEAGYQNITILDISEQALRRTQKRLGKKAEGITWIVGDVTRFKPTKQYDLWHDRATFHFMQTPDNIDGYLSVARTAIKQYMIIGTFSDQGPEKCSGLPVRRYSENMLSNQFSASFKKVRCFSEEHVTPFQTVQHFSFCSFKRKD